MYINDGRGVKSTRGDLGPKGGYKPAERDQDESTGHPHVKIAAFGSQLRRRDNCRIHARHRSGTAVQNQYVEHLIVFKCEIIGLPMTPEIRAFEFAIGVFAVLIGLAIADIATSFHRLLRSETPVNWDPLALSAALYALCMAIYMWFDLWGVRNIAATRYFLFYLLLFAQLFVLFLVAASSLPDEANGPINLRDFYAANRRNFWFLVVLFQIGYVGAGFYFVGGAIAKLPNGTAAMLIAQMSAPLILALILLSTKSRAVHYAGIGLLFAVMLIHYGGASIN
jgi:hypothetical protein